MKRKARVHVNITFRCGFTAMQPCTNVTLRVEAKFANEKEM